MRQSSDRKCRIVTADKHPTAVVKALVPINKLREGQIAARAKICAALPSLNAGSVGLGMTRWCQPMDNALDMEIGVMVERGFEPVGEVVPSTMPAGSAAHFLLVGSYENLPGAWQRLFEWCRKEGLTLAGVNWEIYRDPEGERLRPETSLYALLA
jgi:effector-binding domain-containing protein